VFLNIKSQEEGPGGTGTGGRQLNNRSRSLNLVMELMMEMK